MKKILFLLLTCPGCVTITYRGVAMDASLHFDYNPSIGGLTIVPEIKMNKYYQEIVQQNKVQPIVKLGKPIPIKDLTS